MSAREALRCKCDRVGFDHSAGCCTKVGTIRIDRDGVELWVCVDCIMSPDVKLDPEWDDDWDEEADEVDMAFERELERQERDAECDRLNRLR